MPLLRSPAPVNARRRPLRRVLTAVAMAVAASVTLPAVEALAGDAGPLSCATADAQTQTRVGMVIDFGDLPGAPTHKNRRECVPVKNRGSGADALFALYAGGHLPRTDSSGLICSIDGYPAGTECGEHTENGGYRFWAYFYGDGNGGWTYSGIGPAGRRVQEGGVEGWRFVEGAANPTAPQPAGSSNAAEICPPVAPPTPPPTPAPTTPPPPPPSAGGGSPNPAPTPTPGPIDPTAPATTTTPGAPGGAPGAPSGGDGTAPPDHGDATSPDGVTTATDPTDAGERAGPVDPTAGVDPDQRSAEVLAEIEPTSSDGSSPPVLAAVVVLLLAAGAVWQFRSRRPA